MLTPLITITYFSASEWPARVAMIENAMVKNIVYEPSLVLASISHHTKNNVSISDGEEKLDLVKGTRTGIPGTPIYASNESYTLDKSLKDTNKIIHQEKIEKKEVDNLKLSSTDNPIYILAIGDSLMSEIVAGLRQGLPKNLKIKDIHRASTGLTNQSYYDWPAVAKEQTLNYKPNVVVIHMGGNDGQDMVVNKKWIKFGSEAWSNIYKERAINMVNNIKESLTDVKIIWVGLPAMRETKYANKTKIIENLQKEAAEITNVLYLDGHLALGKEYQKDGVDNGRREVWRADDGIHYSRAGGKMLAKLIGKEGLPEWLEN